jgi:hypothetical protein
MLNKLFSRNKLKPDLVYSQKGNIWRIHFHGDVLACETRDLTSKQVYFFTLNFKTNELYLKDYQIEEKWWVEIESLNDSIIFLNYFKTPELPGHLGITAVDLKTGENKWTNTDLVYWFSTNTDVYTVKELFEKKIYYRIDVGTGEIGEEFNDEETERYLAELQNVQESLRYSGFINAEIYDKDNPSIPEYIKNYIDERFTNIRILGSIEFIEFNNYLAYNYHKDEGVNLKDLDLRNLTNILEIYDTQNETKVYSGTLNKQASNYVPDSFFINEGYLFFIKEKKELAVINLNRKDS